MTVRLTVVTANMGRTYQPGDAEENFQRVRHGFPGALVGWQEVDEADPDNEHKDVDHTFGPDHYRNVGMAHACPISVPSGWTVEEADVTKACNWLAHATPDRWIVSALCSHPLLAAPVVFENGHYPLARLGGKQGRSRWNDTQAAWTKKTAEWHRDGHTIITTRDTNRLRRMPKIHPTERQLLPNAISRISVVPGSVAVAVLGRRDVNLTIDGHDARGVELGLSVR